ncbi:MAG: ATP-dependent DNA helicase RecG [Candidatus Lightella neohaematopini]|nr:ATP-dependent DNA helicase RecG [Candidatus Lightella neohaematopini]
MYPLYKFLLTKSILKINNKAINILRSKGIRNLYDILFYLPVKYHNYKDITLIKDIKLNTLVTIKGIIKNSYTININQKLILICHFYDTSSRIKICFFNAKNIKKYISYLINKTILLIGIARYTYYGIVIVNPEYKLLTNHYIKDKFIPIYQNIKGISQTKIRNIILHALKYLKSNILLEELLPNNNYFFKNLTTLQNALYNIHYPPNYMIINNLNPINNPARKRLAIEELLSYYLNFINFYSKKNYHNINYYNNKLINLFIKNLPFTINESQNNIFKLILNDLNKNTPMVRLLQGDVGSGKTVIAALTALVIISNNKQVAFMVPTEILAIQHGQTFKTWFNPLGIDVCILTKKTNNKNYHKQCSKINNGDVLMIIGTHTLLQKQVHFAKLALIIIDEQQRFGVYQRSILYNKGIINNYYPHQLIMTATPIPRTLAITKYFDINISIMKSLSQQHKIPIITVLMASDKRDIIIKRVYELCVNKMHQIYWVCSIVEPSTQNYIKSAKIVWKELVKKLPGINIGIIYGKLNSLKKQQTIQDFKDGKINILVTSTVVEVGIDIPNANIMIIENADRLGLTQLYQLRGRIGRGNSKSYCVLLYTPPISNVAKHKLIILRNNYNSLFIANKDLELRGPSKLFGLNQIGQLKLKIFNIKYDYNIIKQTKLFAFHINKYYPEKTKLLIKRWLPKTPYVNL